MVRSIYRLGLAVTLATIATACGDGGSSSNGGNGGGGSSTTSTTTTTTTTTTTSGGGTGGDTGGATSSGGTGGSTGGTTTGGGGSGTGGAQTGGGGAGTGGAQTGGTGGMGMGGTGGMGMGGMGGMGGGVALGGSDQIAAVRGAMDGAVNNMPIEGVYVTYTKPVIGQDPAGFFLQGEATGPAIFVAVDPATLNPPVQVGDEVDLMVTDVATVTGLKEITGLGGVTVITNGNAIDLVTDVSDAMDLVTSLDAYESRAIRITGSFASPFVSAGAPQVASPIATMGLTDPNLRLRLPEAVRAQYALGSGCALTADYGVMWRFNAVAQPSVVNASDLKNITCPAPTVVSAVPLSATEVVVNFDRPLDPATVDVADFAFDNGLSAMAVAPSGTAVTVTTSPDVAGITYTVTVTNVNDVLGTAIGMPNSAMFQSYVPVAQMIINEVNPNIAAGHDLVELLVTAPGSTNGIKLYQKATTTDLLATFPDVTVQTGDLIVVHLVPAGTTGIAPDSETMSKTQYANATYSANYDGAWDFLGGATGITFNARVLEIDAPAGAILSATPFVLSNNANPPSGFPPVLQGLQAAGLWMPADCGGALCTYMSTPTAVEISVDLLGSANSAGGNSIQRKLGMDTKQKSDWNAAAAQSFGAPNP